MADRSESRSVGWKTGGTSEVVSAEYFWNLQALIGVHRGGRAAVSSHLFMSCDPEGKCDSLRFGEKTVTAGFLNSVLQNLAEVM